CHRLGGEPDLRRGRWRRDALQLLTTLVQLARETFQLAEMDFCAHYCVAPSESLRSSSGSATSQSTASAPHCSWISPTLSEANEAHGCKSPQFDTSDSREV